MYNLTRSRTPTCIYVLNSFGLELRVRIKLKHIRQTCSAHLTRKVYGFFSGILII